jgi:hypothetical protein
MITADSSLVYSTLKLSIVLPVSPLFLFDFWQSTEEHAALAY